MTPHTLPEGFKPYLQRKVPRYTSYPTANHFHAIEQLNPEAWLAQLEATLPVSLYLHIPFCRDICTYCGCATKASRKDRPIDDYVKRLIKEIDHKAAFIPHRQKASMISWGGGTPGLLSQKHFETILAALHKVFDVSDLKEHAIEIDPRTYDEAKAQVLSAIGITRVSFGVQDLNPHVQQAIGRVQPYEMLENAVAWTRGSGISQINFDLMYGLPSQSFEDLRYTVQQAAHLAPERVALFGYAHMPALRKNQRLIDEAALPNASLRFDQSQLAARELISKGYHMIGFDHFAAPQDGLAVAASTGQLKRNFQGYGTDAAENLIGFGASAISTLPNGYAQNTAETKAYMAQIDAGLSGLTRGHPTSNQDKWRRKIINTLLCDFTFDLNALALPHDLRLAVQRDMQKLRPYAEIGMIEMANSTVRILPEAHIFARLIASAFDSYLPEHVLNHAVAV